MKKIIIASLFVLLFLFVYLFFQLGLNTLFGFIVTMLCLFKYEGNIDVPQLIAEVESIVLNNTLYILLISAVVSLPIYYVICRLRHQNIFRVCEFNKTKGAVIILTAILGIASSIFLSSVLSFIPVGDWFPEHERLMSILIGGNNLFVILLVTGIVAPFIEELIFRGLILNELNKVTSVTLAVVIQGVLFGLYHLNPLQFIYGTLLGLLLGYVAVWTKSIWPSIILHVFINSTSTVIGTFMTDEFMMTYRYWLLAVCLVIIAAITAFLFKNRGREAISNYSELES